MAPKAAAVDTPPDDVALLLASMTPAGGLNMSPATAAAPESEAFPGESQLTEEEKNRWLILHVSLPRTVMTFDSAEKRDTEAELNDVLANMAWGTIDEQTREFVVQSEDPTLDPPHDSLISYAEFVQRKFPADRNMKDDARVENLRMAAELRSSFTNHEQPGQKFRPMFDQMVKNLAHSNKSLVKAFEMKKTILKESDVPLDPARSDAQNIMRFGRHRVLPAFWQLLMNLVSTGRRFSIVFRCFDKDQLDFFLQDYQMFCDTKHPAYCGSNKTQKPKLMNGEKGSKNFKLADMNIGHLDRKNGKMEFPKRPAAGTEVAPAAVPPPAADADGGAVAAEPAAAVAFTPASYSFPPYHSAYAGLMHQILGIEGGGTNVAAIVDDLEYWDANDRAAEAGKLLLVDHAGSLAETKVQHIFFDGNIKRSDGYSVDIRDVVDGKSVSSSEAENIFFHRVNFFEAVVDQEYFIKALETCESKMSQKVVQTRRMVDAISADLDKPDVLKTLPSKEYLHRAVIPALMPAIEACQRVRPADPIEFIAFYMLRHPKQYSKTLKP